MLVRKWPGTTLRCSTSTGADDVIDGMPTRKLRFAGDSPLEGDGFEPSVPVRSLTQTRSNGDVQHLCAASRMTIGTQIGFAIGGFAPVVAAAVQGEGPNAWVPVAPLNSPIGVVASIAAWTARETQHSDARLRVNRRLPTLTPPRFGAKRLEQRRDWRISENMIGVRS